MKERIKRKKLSFAMGIAVVLALFAGVVFVAAAAYVASRALYSHGITVPYAQYAQYLFYIILGVYIVRNYITEYEYTVTDNQFIVDRILGSRQKNILRIHINDIVSINKTAPRKRPVQRLTFRSKKSGGVYMAYIESGKEKYIYLSLSADMLAFTAKRASSDNKR
ncbi:MAG: hypothetical protein WDA65_03165 [Christensenellales bacterium]